MGKSNKKQFGICGQFRSKSQSSVTSSYRCTTKVQGNKQVRVQNFIPEFRQNLKFYPVWLYGRFLFQYLCRARHLNLQHLLTLFEQTSVSENLWIWERKGKQNKEKDWLLETKILNFFSLHSNFKFFSLSIETED